MLTQDGRDHAEDGASPTISGSITAIQTNRIFDDSAAAFDPDSDEILRGAPILFTSTDGSSTQYRGRVGRTRLTTRIELQEVVTDSLGVAVDPVVGWTYSIGPISWAVKTGYVAPTFPARTMEHELVSTNYEKVTAADSLDVAVTAYDPPGTEVAVATVRESTDALINTTAIELTTKAQGRAFQVELTGDAVNAAPKMARVLHVVDERSGK